MDRAPGLGEAPSRQGRFGTLLILSVLTVFKETAGPTLPATARDEGDARLRDVVNGARVAQQAG